MNEDISGREGSEETEGTHIGDVLGQVHAVRIILILGEAGPARFTDVDERMPVTNFEAIAGRLREMCQSGLAEQTPDGYALTARGERLYTRLDPNCIGAFVRKHALPIMFVIDNHGPIRYTEIERAVDTNSSKTVTRRLEELGNAGLVARNEYGYFPACVEYSLSDRGRELFRTMRDLGLDRDEPRTFRPVRTDRPGRTDDSATPVDSSRKVSAKACGQLRQLAKEGLSTVGARDELDLDVGTSTICRHVNGYCSCETEESPQEFSGHSLSPDVCGTVRQLAADGLSAPDVIEELDLDISRTTLYRHASGGCSCDPDRSPSRFHSKGISPTDCRTIRQQLRSRVDPAAGDSPFERADVEEHGTGSCTHDIDEPPVATTTNGATVPADMCRVFNRLYHEDYCHTGQIKEQTRDQFEEVVAERTIQDHVLGECDHPP